VTWLAWRQVRLSLAALAGLLVVLTALLVPYGLHLAHVYDTVVATCASHGDCTSVTKAFSHEAEWARFLDLGVVAVPALLGVFWGAPLVARELETGTARLAWTQSATRTRWFVSRAAVMGLLAMAVAASVTLLVTWWATPVDRLTDAPYAVFDQRDLVPVAYGAFAFALGAGLGAVVRRTVPAMAGALAGFTGVRLAVTEWVRPRLLTPTVLTNAFDPWGSAGSKAARLAIQRGLVMSDDVYSGAGKLLGHNGGIGANGTIGFRPHADGTTTFLGVGTCPNAFPPSPVHRGELTGTVGAALQRAAHTCATSFHLKEVVTFQPAAHYWPLQWMESGIYVLLAAGLLAGTWWWVRRRIA
jgi:hypothetical protein